MKISSKNKEKIPVRRCNEPERRLFIKIPIAIRFYKM